MKTFKEFIRDVELTESQTVCRIGSVMNEQSDKEMPIRDSLKAVVSDAAEAGFTVDDLGYGGYKIYKKNKSGRTIAGILISASGSAIRIDIDISLASTIRGLANYRKALGIK